MADIMKEIWGDALRRTGAEATIKDKCATDLKLFAETYLPHVFSSPWSRFHIDSMNKLKDIFYEHPDENTYDLIIAPRGHSKSSIFSFLSIIHACCYQTKRFILLISATGPAAKQFIIDLENELEFNEAIKKDFGEIKGDIWNTTDFQTRGKHGVYVSGRGSGAQVRGLKMNGSSRPDLIIVDDLETMDHVISPVAGENLERWFNSDLLPVGAPGKASYIVVGTVLAYNSLLNKMLTEPRYSMWRRRKYTAVIHDSTDTEDWETWEDIMLDGSREDSYGDALSFYQEHREKMLEGVEILWPERQKDMYLFLRTAKLNDEDAFNTEYLNSPISEKTRTFKTEWIEANMYDELPRDSDGRDDISDVSAAIDPSMGRSRRADTSAIIFLGRCKTDGNIYILDASIAVRKPQELIEDIEELIRKWYSYNPLITVETNVFQEFFASTLNAEFTKKGIYVKWNEIAHKGHGDNKERRILSLVPHIKNGHIKFPRGGARQLISQLKNWPRDRDDGPDALEMALRPLLDLGRAKFSFGSIETGAKNFKQDPTSRAMNDIRKRLGIFGSDMG